MKRRKRKQLYSNIQQNPIIIGALYFSRVVRKNPLQVHLTRSNTQKTC